LALADWAFARFNRQLFHGLCRVGVYGSAGSSCGAGPAERAESGMSEPPILRLASLKNVDRFQEHLRSLRVTMPCDAEILCGTESPLRWPLVRGDLKIRNRIAVQPMEGWDGTADGNPSERTLRRWKRFGRSGAGLIWGGEAVAVSHEGRANPNQLVIAQ